jgi:hypothetical protein
MKKTGIPDNQRPDKWSSTALELQGCNIQNSFLDYDTLHEFCLEKHFSARYKGKSIEDSSPAHWSCKKKERHMSIMWNSATYNGDFCGISYLGLLRKYVYTFQI